MGNSSSEDLHNARASSEREIAFASIAASEIQRERERIVASFIQQSQQNQKENAINQEFQTAQNNLKLQLDKDIFAFKSSMNQYNRNQELKTLEINNCVDQLRQLETERDGLQNSLAAINSQVSDLTEKISELNSKILRETIRLNELNCGLMPENCVRIVLAGPTGEGKSTSGNRLCGDTSEQASEGPFATSSSIKSETIKIKSVAVPQDSGLIRMVTDPPGILDSSNRDEQFHISFIEFLRGVKKIDCILLVKSGNIPRIGGNYQQMLRDLEESLGTEMWKSVVFLITKISQEFASTEEFAKYRMEFISFIQSEFPAAKQFPVLCVDNYNLEMCQRIYGVLVNSIIPKLSCLECNALFSPLDAWNEELTNFGEKLITLEQEQNQWEVKLDDINSKIIFWQQKKLTEENKHFQRPAGSVTQLRDTFNSNLNVAINIRDTKLNTVEKTVLKDDPLPHLWSIS